jgi:hypothetical protein
MGLIKTYDSKTTLGSTLFLCFGIICVIKICAGLFDAVFGFATIKEKDSTKFNY